MRFRSKYVPILALLAVGLFWAAPAAAQTGSVTGTILDSSTGQPLDAVQVSLETVGSGETRYGGLTQASSAEQAGAGLDRCSESEFSEFTELNDRYRAKFDFPFIVAVRGLTRESILERFRVRVHNDWDSEFDEALNQVHRIARLRIEQVFENL